MHRFFYFVIETVYCADNKLCTVLTHQVLKDLRKYPIFLSLILLCGRNDVNVIFYNMFFRRRQ